MKSSIQQIAAAVALMIILSLSPSLFANPDYTIGVWKNIGGPDSILANTYAGATYVAIDPSNPSTIYFSPDVKGLWKSTDGGSTWARIGTPPASMDWDGIHAGLIHYLDNPDDFVVDPNDPKHIYATEGVRGDYQGFWTTTDGGATWKKSNLIDGSGNSYIDVTRVQVDPTDFNHLLVTTHTTTNPGVFESKDGGATFVCHPNNYGWPGGSSGCFFLYNPALHIGNKDTWLVTPDGGGYWRTTDGGASWNKVNDYGCQHGGTMNIYYTPNGTLYTGTGYNGIIRSTDNGATWSTVTVPNGGYYGVMGDGTRMYTMCETFSPTPTLTTLESDGLAWTNYSQQKLDRPAHVMAFDPVNRILYAACWNAGLWAMKVDGGASAAHPIAQGVEASHPNGSKNSLTLPGMIRETQSSRAMVGLTGQKLNAKSRIGTGVVFIK